MTTDPARAAEDDSLGPAPILRDLLTLFGFGLFLGLWWLAYLVAG